MITYILLSILFLFNIYLIVYYHTNSEIIKNKEDEEKDNQEIIWFYISLFLCMVCAIIITLKKTTDLINIDLKTDIIIPVLSAITMSLSWDYFSRKNKIKQRDISMFLSLISFCILLIKIETLY